MFILFFPNIDTDCDRRGELTLCERLYCEADPLANHARQSDREIEIYLEEKSLINSFF